jgi:hypothetical protein
MIRALCIAALPLLLVPGCASVDKTAAANGGGSGTYYCWKDRLATDGDSLTCNWEKSKSDACRSTYNTPLGKGSVASGPEGSSRCENGQWLVKVTTK